MARPRQDGGVPRATLKRKFTDGFVRGLKADGDRPTLAYDLHQGGLVVVVQPSGAKSWKALYYANRGQPRWYHIGKVDDIGLRDARQMAARVMLRAAAGEDPVAQRKAERLRGSFEEMATAYVERYAKKNNKSWAQADRLVRRYLLPKWSKLQASSIARSDVRAMHDSIDAPVLANQVVAAASAIFSWGIREEIVAANPCSKIDRNETQDRERVLSETEVPKFWQKFDALPPLKGAALKLILLTGQRPGEVQHIRREHVVDGWWEMPGKPVKDMNWPGTKNGENHRVWLPRAAAEILDDLDGDQPLAKAGRISDAMIDICDGMKVKDRVTPHDLRRTHGTMITGLGFGRDAMNRIQNHVEGGIASVYDRHGYAEENKRIMKAVASKILLLAEGAPPSNVRHLGARR